MDYVVERSKKRKTLQLGVRPDGTVVVKAPAWSKEFYIDEFVNKHLDWIEARQKKLNNTAEAKRHFEICIGDFISIMGVRYQVMESPDLVVRFNNTGFYIPSSPFDDLRPAFIKIFKSFAKATISKKAEYWSEITGFRYTQVSINSAKKRWASRSSTGRLNFAWRLIFADEDIVDYVVIHELCHTAEMNHSPAFWAHVAEFCPDYKAKKKRLNQLYERLQTEDWD